MKSYNYFYSNENRLLKYINNDKINLNTKALVQIFSSKQDIAKLQDAVNSVLSILPNSSIISTTTAGEIIEGGMNENTIVISISVFEDTDVKVSLFEKDEPKNIAKSILDTMVTPRTKLLIIFNNLFHNDAECLLQEIDKVNSNVMIAGGNAANNQELLETFVGVNTKISSTGVAVAALCSDTLHVENGYLLNWNKIGRVMIVTKSKDSTIYEIDNKPAVEVYRHYLGDKVADSLPVSGIEFPLIFRDDEIDIARAPIAKGEDGSLIMAGHIKENTRVQFAFGSKTDNENKSKKIVSELSKNPIESIFIYSCSARKVYLKNNLNNEFNLFQQISSTAGFITYGEFYHNKRNHLLNVSSTYITLSESQTKKNIIKIEKEDKVGNRTAYAMNHLIQTTADELNDQKFNLQQFQDVIKNTTIYSTTNLKGIITDVNDMFCELSGYDREELIGKSHSIVRHPNVSKEIYIDVWNTIKSKKTWNGIIENMSKDGSSYFVYSNIIPMLDFTGNISYYLSIRNDVTQEVLKERKLEVDATYYEDLYKEKEHLLHQYENVINSSSAHIRIDPNFNIKYVNDVFCSIYGEKEEYLLKMNHNDLVDETFLDENKERILKILKKDKKYSGLIKLKKLDESILYLDATYNAIYDKEENIVEYMAIYHNVTEIIEIQEEIEKTQSDVIYTMGSIGETRSKETGNHVKRVAEYSKYLALFYGLSKDDAHLLKTASPMHDIGKVGIPDSILNKPGKLTDEEFKIMKTHSILGYQMLKHSTRTILKTAAIVAYTHHEHWDGNGYPKKLKGLDIPIFGRITSIADVFDALGSDRCYKKAWSDKDIFALLKDGRGKQFEPKLVDIFFDNLDIFLEIRDKFKD